MIRRRTLLAALVLAACAPKGEASNDGAAADSAAVDPAPMVATDSGAAAPVGTTGAAVVDSATAAKVGKGVQGMKAQPTGMGRDSAFGPTFVVDSTGKMIPIEKKKP
ncbi:MAG: hypothetical protein KJZ74_05025 [Gemmatimonadales bacterium]|nr:hypothetical protein [Gemmatimonadales bacterium]